MAKNLCLRVSRHTNQVEPRLAALRPVFGLDVEIHHEDVQYRGNPRQAIQAVLDRLKSEGHQVVGVEVVGGADILEQLVGPNGLELPVLQAEFARDVEGQIKTAGKEAGSGRDVFAFGRYVQVKRAGVNKRPFEAADLPVSGSIRVGWISRDTDEQLVDMRRQALEHLLPGRSVELVVFDCKFGDDPLTAIKAALPDGLHALDPGAGFVYTKLVGDRGSRLGVPVLNARFECEPGSRRAKVVGQDSRGRDILAFTGYDLVESLVLETEPLVGS